MKKILCLILCVCMIIPFGIVAGAETKDDKCPVIVVRGMNFARGLMFDRETENPKYVEMKVDAKGIFNTLAGAAGAVMSTLNPDEGVKVIADYVALALDGYKCDGNGDSFYKNITAESYPEAAGNYEVFNMHAGEGEIGLTNALVDHYGGDRVYYFVYDWRLDPLDNCDGLEIMIQRALKENNAKKVDIICCSMGGSITMAYMAKYGYDKLDTVISNTSVMGGSDVVNDLFQGKAYFEPLAVENKLRDVLPNSHCFISLLTKTGILAMLCNMLNNFVEKYKDIVFERALIPTLATLPGFWSMVYGENYKVCREYIFGKHMDEYPGLIRRMDNFYDKVSSRREKIIKDALDANVKIVMLANYNTPLICAYENASYQGDGVVETKPEALGATVSKVGQRLTAEQIAKADTKYLSPDLCIDATTCMLPDYTWFGRDAGHVVGNYGSEYTDFLFVLLESDVQPTIDMWKEYPQFLQSDKEEHLSPVTPISKEHRVHG